ncbi:MAG: PHP domain-containing protein [Spirochaetales bacterium]|nr:MAG: PHP domain-containing protein [Spirochaetales bacterium]
MDEAIFRSLNSPDRAVRFAAIDSLKTAAAGVNETPPRTEEVNNHVHTIYSFSPYSPAMAAFKAWQAGLKAVGIMDHDSIAGAGELLACCAALRIGSTAGIEIRVNMNGTGLENKKINNPDSLNSAYIAIHGIPGPRLEEAAKFLRPINEARNRRNRRETERLSAILSGYGLGPLDFDKDVYPLSRAVEGGSITERHILAALALRLEKTAGRGGGLAALLTQKLKVPVSGKLASYLSDADNPHYLYDVIGVLKGSFVERFYEDPDTDECVNVKEAVDFALSLGAIPAYAYLGDVTESPTGDKKAEKFEDDFLDELMPLLKNLGFKAVTYMPPRNTLPQLKRIQRCCKEFELMEISGVDINSSRQIFNCPIVLKPDFVHLVDATWALVAHEKLAGLDERYALFSPRNPLAESPLAERLERYAAVGRAMDHGNPEKALEYVRF